MAKRLVSVGPTPAEIYPRSAWTKAFPIGVPMKDVWQIVGPQVDMHLRTLPLWKVICLVYIEGLAHGSAMAEEIMKKND